MKMDIIHFCSNMAQNSEYYSFNKYETFLLKNPQTIGTAQIKIKKDLTCKLFPIQNEYSNNWKMFSHFSELFTVINALFRQIVADLQTFNIHVIV